MPPIAGVVPRAVWAVPIARSCRQNCAILVVSIAVIVPSVEVEGKIPSVPKADPAVQRPNILVITLDTGPTTWAFTGMRQNTPHLQVLKTSAIYTKAIASGPITLSSHASMFTGLYPQSHAAYLSRPLVPQIPTLAKYLCQMGIVRSG
jgi:hypothetical protein